MKVVGGEEDEGGRRARRQEVLFLSSLKHGRCSFRGCLIILPNVYHNQFQGRYGVSQMIAPLLAKSQDFHTDSSFRSDLEFEMNIFFHC